MRVVKINNNYFQKCWNSLLSRVAERIKLASNGKCDISEGNGSW